MKKYNALLLVLFTCNTTLYGAANDKLMPKSDVEKGMASAITETTLLKPTTTNLAKERPKYIPTAGKQSDIRNAQVEYKFLVKNKDIDDRRETSLPIISNSFNRINCSVTHRLASFSKRIYNNQHYRIRNTNELTGPLGDLLCRLDTLNKELTNRQWVCSCRSNSDLIMLKSEFGAGDIKSLRVPTNRSFDIALTKEKPDHYYLTVYEQPGYQPPLSKSVNNPIP